jgi:hypothetical protein
MSRGPGSFALFPAALLLACRSNVSLGDPDAGAVAPSCEAQSGERVVASIDASLGTVRALSTDGYFLYVALAQGAGPGTLARVAVSGGTLEVVAPLDAPPSRIALDAAYAYVTSSASDEVWRVTKETFDVAVAKGQTGATAIVADGRGAAYWTLPALARIGTWNFAVGAPSEIVSSADPTDLALDVDTLFVEGTGGLDTIALGSVAAPAPLAAHCGGGTIAFDESSVYCAEGARILRVARSSGATSELATAPGSVDGVLVAAGRVFWRASAGGRAYVMSVPLDGIGGPTALVSIGDPGAPWAADDCGVSWVAGGEIFIQGI